MSRIEHEDTYTVTCSKCGGTGRAKSRPVRRCSNCDGWGKVRGERWEYIMERSR